MILEDFTRAQRIALLLTAIEKRSNVFLMDRDAVFEELGLGSNPHRFERDTRHEQLNSIIAEAKEVAAQAKKKITKVVPTSIDVDLFKYLQEIVEKNDSILEFEGKRVKSNALLFKHVFEFKDGSKIRFEVRNAYGPYAMFIFARGRDGVPVGNSGRLDGIPKEFTMEHRNKLYTCVFEVEGGAW